MGHDKSRPPRAYDFWRNHAAREKEAKAKEGKPGIWDRVKSSFRNFVTDESEYARRLPEKLKAVDQFITPSNFGSFRLPEQQIEEEPEVIEIDDAELTPPAAPKKVSLRPVAKPKKQTLRPVPRPEPEPAYNPMTDNPRIRSGIRNALTNEGPRSEELSMDFSSGPESDNTPFQSDSIRPEYGGNKTMDMYLQHIQNMPNLAEYKPGLWHRIVSGLAGAFEGGQRGAGAGLATSRGMLMEPYERQFGEWAAKADALKSGAQLEGQDMGRYLRMVDTNSRIGDRAVRQEQGWARIDQGDERLNIGRQNAQTRAQALELRRQQFERQGAKLEVGHNGELIWFFPDGNIIPTGVTALEYQKFQQQKNYQNQSLGMRSRALDHSKERIGQRWSHIDFLKQKEGLQ